MTLMLTAAAAVALSFGLARGLPALKRALEPSGPAPTPAEREASLRLARLESEAKRTPCNKEATLAWAQALSQTQQWRAAVAAAEDFLSRCDKAPALRALAYTGHMQLGEPQLAVRDAEELVAASPRNTTYRLWRARAVEAAGNLEGALADYAALFEEKPEQRQLALAYANAQEKLQRPCDAAATLSAHASRSPTPGPAGLELSMRIEQLLTSGGCKKARR